MKCAAWGWTAAIVLGLGGSLVWVSVRDVNAVEAGGSAEEVAATLPAGEVSAAVRDKANDAGASVYTGSGSCWECHKRFHELWADSWHGLAMQPFSEDFAERELTGQDEPIVMGEYAYCFDKETGKVHEEGPGGENDYPIAHVMGGKYLYYFLTPMSRGRLQVLPVAYDVRKKEWYDTTASMVRHAAEWEDAPLNWKERPLTFNTTCFDCHVSQLATNYDLATDSYKTEWSEPGINCETCHGPGEAHIRVCRQAKEGEVPADLKIIRVREFSAEQNNSLCGPCHAKMRPITSQFQPGDEYFEHYDLVSLEHRDFYPDGRDLGENYTYTLWRLSPCAQSGQLDCTHCHTSSGRNRFQGDKANQACMPCHKEHVQRPAAHTHHPAESAGSVCVNCHMPMTHFARMDRSDHSMRPPAPAATKAFGSPNACNICHAEESAEWADGYVRKWRERDYQTRIVRQGKLVEAARKGEWERLGEILDYLQEEDREEVYAVALIRLLEGHEDERIGPVLRKVLREDGSPWVRSAAASVLNLNFGMEAMRALLAATKDESRLVRVRAAASLAGLPMRGLGEDEQKGLAKATEEYLASLQVRPDDWSSHYNVGNFHFARGQLEKALDAFRTARRLQPKAIQPLVNASMAQARLGNRAEAEQLLVRALEVDPGSVEAHFNLALLAAEQEDYARAEEHLRKALEADPKFARAAYNLGILLARRDLRQASEWCARAAELAPQEPRFAYTQAFYQRQSGELEAAGKTLGNLIERHPGYVDGYLLLGQVYAERGLRQKAKDVYQKALGIEGLSPRDQYRVEATLSQL